MKIVSILAVTIILATTFMSKMQAQTEGSFTDKRDGKTYKTIKIGNQVWMAENLAFKADSGCWINEDLINNYYGCFYNWETAKKAAPEGWHLPTNKEYLTLWNNFKKKKVYKELLKGGKSKFNALYAGIRLKNGKFVAEEGMAVFWAYNQVTDEYAYSLVFQKEKESVTPSGANPKFIGASVRLVKD